tara:strand:+ start:943 stop:1359 length:417 start_codon:yes stop_codon:yes gene_type:complete
MGERSTMSIDKKNQNGKGTYSMNLDLSNPSSTVVKRSADIAKFSQSIKSEFAGNVAAADSIQKYLSANPQEARHNMATLKHKSKIAPMRPAPPSKGGGTSATPSRGAPSKTPPPSGDSDYDEYKELLANRYKKGGELL